MLPVKKKLHFQSLTYSRNEATNVITVVIRLSLRQMDDAATEVLFKQSFFLLYGLALVEESQLLMEMVHCLTRN